MLAGRGRKGTMSAYDLPGRRAVMLQVANALARYERHVRKLAATWLDMDLYQTVSEEIEEIKRQCAAAPELRVPWTHTLISHAELIHALWRQGDHAGATPEVDAALSAHLSCVDALARRCLRAEAAIPEQPPGS